MPPSTPYPTQPSNDYSGYQPAPNTVSPPQPSGQPNPADAKTTKNRTVLILFTVAVLELLLILGLLFALSHKSKAIVKPATTANTSSGAPQPATSTSLQQTNDSISQDLSGLSNDRDFPAHQLDDSSLGL